MPTQEFFEDKQIIKYTIANESRAEIEAWAEMVIETGRTWDKDKPYCVIEDFRAIKVLTPGIRGFVEKVNDYYRSLELTSANIAVLIQQNTMGSFTGRVFVERELYDHYFNRKVFTREEDAIAWLKEFLPESID